MIETLIYLGAGLLTISIPTFYFIRERNKSRRASQTLQKSIEHGLNEPPSLHPIIDPDICIGSAACVKVCPEQGILSLIDNRGELVKPSACIGHGECQLGCPVDAITLVFGTEKRGVDIPHLSPKFETNVSGIYIAGELGGMGLIRNAVTQGKEAVEYIFKSINELNQKDILDLLIIGAGPAGISASLQAKKEGLNFLVVDQEDLGGTILTYPRQKLVMTQPMDLPLHGKIKKREILKEELLDLFGNVYEKFGLSVNSNEKVSSIVRDGEYFDVLTSKSEYKAQRILLSIGRRGSPRKLGVDGEKSSKVTYRLLDPDKYQNKNILVVGGGDSAVEAAVALSDHPENRVCISYRGGVFSRIKEGNKTRIEKAIENGQVSALFNSNVKLIKEDKVIIDQSGKEIVLPNDYVFVFVGGELPSEFLEKVGIKFTRKFGQA
jgi:thioredoxin reductase/NAD-dependent dihydropyrimidine dehydrogenase PreA subunit